jgi:hypothetical protein
LAPESGQRRRTLGLGRIGRVQNSSRHIVLCICSLEIDIRNRIGRQVVEDRRCLAEWTEARFGSSLIGDRPDCGEHGAGKTGAAKDLHFLNVAGNTVRGNDNFAPRLWACVHGDIGNLTEFHAPDRISLLKPRLGIDNTGAANGSFKKALEGGEVSTLTFC